MMQVREDTVAFSSRAKLLEQGVCTVDLRVQLSTPDLGYEYIRDPSSCIVPADGALLVYDITDIESFNKVRKWVKELRKIVGTGIAIAIAGNKCDLEKSRAVTQEEAVR